MTASLEADGLGENEIAHPSTVDATWSGPREMLIGVGW